MAGEDGLGVRLQPSVVERFDAAALPLARGPGEAGEAALALPDAVQRRCRRGRFELAEVQRKRPKWAGQLLGHGSRFG